MRAFQPFHFLLLTLVAALCLSVQAFAADLDQAEPLDGRMAKAKWFDGDDDDDDDSGSDSDDDSDDDDDDDSDSDDDDDDSDSDDGSDSDDDDSDATPFVKNRPNAELFELQLGPQFIGRFFDYTESIANTANLRPYSVFGPPALYVRGVVYPLATLDIPVAGDFGLSASYVHAFGLSSEDTQGRKFDTLHNEFKAGLRYRQRLADAADNPAMVGVEGEFGLMNFTLEPADDLAQPIAAEVATASYSYLRVGLFGRIPLGGERVALLPRVGYIGPFTGGEAYTRFNAYTIGGIDAELMAAFVIADGFEARVGGEYTRYFSAFDPLVGDAYVAGGALDQLVAIRATAAYVF